jgi:hypothetical protein
MEIQIDEHTSKRAEERGTTEVEIRDTLKTGKSFQGKRGRLGKAKIYPLQQERNGKFYQQK